MIEIPQRREYVSREDYIGAASLSIAGLKALAEAEPVAKERPEWAQSGQGETIFHARVPAEVLEHPGGEHWLLRAIIIGLRHKRVTIRRAQRVLQDGEITLWVEVA